MKDYQIKLHTIIEVGVQNGVDINNTFLGESKKNYREAKIDAMNKMVPAIADFVRIFKMKTPVIAHWTEYRRNTFAQKTKWVCVGRFAETFGGDDH